MSGIPDAVSAILDAVRAIPCGRVAAYGEVATNAGLPRRARMVGQVLRELPEGSDVPWYRVVRADGSIAFPPGSDGFLRQTAALRAEGVEVVAGRVGDAARQPEQNLDALLWGPPDG